VNRLWSALAGVVAAVALVLACSGLGSAADASAPSRSGTSTGTSTGTSAGAVVLMTQEFYQEARQRLNPGGVMASFIASSNQANQKMLVRTFRASFRYMMVFRGYAGLMLLGSEAPMKFRTSAIMKVFGSPAARADLANAPDYRPVPVTSWPSIIHRRLRLTDDHQVDAYAGPGPLLTDDHPLSEYFLIHDFDLRSKAFERRALQLALVVTSLLALLVISVALEALWRRMRPLPGMRSSLWPAPGGSARK